MSEQNSLHHFDPELERRMLDALAEFAAGAGHEINNPLAIINGQTQLLLREITHPEHRRQLAQIAAQVKRAYEMIADIRLFARPPKPEPKRFDLIEVLNTLHSEQCDAMNEADIEFHVNGTERIPFFIESDPIQLLVVLNALCNNAREALLGDREPKTKKVEVRLDLSEVNNVTIYVEDNGLGISPEIRPLIFCPYFSGREAGRGLGFGLPKSWRLMQQLGGSLELREHDTGTLFACVLAAQRD